MSGFADARWYTYRQASALGGQVRRGERGTQVIYWQFIEKQQAAAGDETEGEAGDVKHGRRIPLLRCYVVFNHEQVAWPASETEPAKPPVENVEPGFENVRALVTSTGAVIRHAGVRAYYAPSDDRITLPEPSRFGSPADYGSTALREAPHAAGSGAGPGYRVPDEGPPGAAGPALGEGSRLARCSLFPQKIARAPSHHCALSRSASHAGTTYTIGEDFRSSKSSKQRST
jgi:hypothetical protein